MLEATGRGITLKNIPGGREGSSEEVNLTTETRGGTGVGQCWEEGQEGWKKESMRDYPKQMKEQGQRCRNGGEGSRSER